MRTYIKETSVVITTGSVNDNYTQILKEHLEKINSCLEKDWKLHRERLTTEPLTLFNKRFVFKQLLVKYEEEYEHKRIKNN